MKPEDILGRRAGDPVRQGTGYWAFVPKPLPPTLDYSPALAKLLDQASHRLGELAGLGRMLPNPWLVVEPAVRREAVQSSRIEGTSTSIDALYRFEAKAGPVDDPADAREVHNYVAALEDALKRVDTLALSLRLIREIHERLMRGARKQAGDAVQLAHALLQLRERYRKRLANRRLSKITRDLADQPRSSSRPMRPAR